MTAHDRTRRAAEPAPLPRSRRPIRAGLEVGPVDDPMEVEAEATADRVLAAIKASGATAALASRASAEEEEPLQGSRTARASAEEEEPLQGSRTARAGLAVGAEGGPVDAGLEGRLTAGAGRPLPEPVRATMERAYGADFSAVRVSENPAAAEIGARAYTTGAEVRFAPGQYQPDTPAGQHLLAHELTHVVQQGAAAARSVVRRDVVAGAGLTAQDLEAIAKKVCYDSVAHVLNKLGKPVAGPTLQDLGGKIADGGGAIPDGAVVNFMRRDYSAKSYDELFVASRHTMLSVGGGRAWATNSGCLGGPGNWAENAIDDLVVWEDGPDGLKAWPRNDPRRVPASEIMVVWSMP